MKDIRISPSRRFRLSQRIWSLSILRASYCVIWDHDFPTWRLLHFAIDSKPVMALLPSDPGECDRKRYQGTNFGTDKMLPAIWWLLHHRGSVWQSFNWCYCRPLFSVFIYVCRVTAPMTAHCQNCQKSDCARLYPARLWGTTLHYHGELNTCDIKARRGPLLS